MDIHDDLLTAARAVLALELDAEGCTADHDEMAAAVARLSAVSARHKRAWLDAYVAGCRRLYPELDAHDLREQGHMDYPRYCHGPAHMADYYETERAPPDSLWFVADRFEGLAGAFQRGVLYEGFNNLRHDVGLLRAAVSALSPLDHRHLRPATWKPF